MRLTQTLALVSAALGLTSAGAVPKIAKRSPAADLVDGKYLVDRQTEFAHHSYWSFAGSTLPSGLRRSVYPVGSIYEYTAANVNVRGGYLELLVPGRQTSQPYKCGEVVTEVTNIRYASVRTVAIFTEPAGVCNGMFFYKSDSQETDIEWLSDANSLSNQGTRKVWFTNQDANGDGQKTYRTFNPPADATSAEHEYRLDWTEGLVEWYIDGTKVWETRSDVPSVSGPWVFNNWANGDKGWSAGPPAVDAVFKIRSIDMYYNTA